MSIEERLYSEAFEDGVNYVIQRMFADKTEKDKKKVTMRQAELEEQLGSNWDGVLPAYFGGNLPAYLIGRSEINKALREGKDDDELKEKANKVGRINRYIQEGGGAASLGFMGGIFGYDPKLSWAMPGVRNIRHQGLRTAAGATLGAASGYGLGKLYGKLGEYAINRNADEAIRRRTKYREDKD